MNKDGAPAWWVSFLLIVALALVGYGFILQPGQVLYGPHSDILAYHLGAKEVLWRSLEAGRGIPFWRADQLSGGPAFTPSCHQTVTGANFTGATLSVIVHLRSSGCA